MSAFLSGSASIALMSEQAGAHTAWVHLVPAGTFTGIDGRGPYRLADAASVIAETRQRAGKRKMVIDYEHQSINSQTNGKPAPAAGWIVGMEARADGIWGLVEWTEAAAAHIAKREYRYISPVFRHAKDGTVISIDNAALTNSPNLDQLVALNRAGATIDNDLASQLAAAAKLLGLPETAGQADILAKFNELSALASDIASLTGDQSFAAHSANPDPTKFVPIGDFESTVAVPRNTIEDDTYGVYSPMVEELGRVAAVHPDQLVFDLLGKGFSQKCHDGQYFFDTDHPVGSENKDSVANTDGGAGEPWFLLDTSRVVRPIIYQERRPFHLVRKDDERDDNVFFRKEYIYGVDGRSNAGFGLWQLAWGSKQTLDAAHYATARAAMQKFKGDEGRPLGVKPTLLVVGPDNEQAALKLINTATLENGESNPWHNTVEIIVTPWAA